MPFDCGAKVDSNVSYKVFSHGFCVEKEYLKARNIHVNHRFLLIYIENLLNIKYNKYSIVSY